MQKLYDTIQQEEDEEKRGKCFTSDKGELVRFVCSEKNIKLTAFHPFAQVENGLIGQYKKDDSCQGPAKYTKVFEWDNCQAVHRGGETVYVMIKSAIALKTAIVGAALAFTASQF